jgi:hypothetical protein
MSIFIDEKRRRVEQFAQYLRLMGLRRHKVVNDDCFIIFEDSPPEDAESPKLKESVAIKVDCLADGGSTSGGGEPGESPGNDWQGGEDQSRFIQFAFKRDCFYMELPNNTVFPPEVEQILRHSMGFYWAQDRPDLRWVRGNWKDMVKWNPLQKVYLYRDEQSAAEDMAFILFQVWNFPVDSPLYVKAAAFQTNHRFERGKRID